MVKQVMGDRGEDYMTKRLSCYVGKTTFKLGSTILTSTFLIDIISVALLKGQGLLLPKDIFSESFLCQQFLQIAGPLCAKKLYFGVSCSGLLLPYFEVGCSES